MTLKVVTGSPTLLSSRPSPADNPAKDPKTHAPRVRLLVVDDEPSICKALTRAFPDAYLAIAALSGESALSIIRNEHVDVMLIDLRIPDMRGDVIFEVAAGYQPHLRYQTIFMTGDISSKARQLIEACRCNFLYKPFEFKDLLPAIAAVTPRIQDAAG